MGMAIAILAILGFGFHVSRFVKCPLESSLLFICSSLIILLYAAGLLGCLQIGVQLILGIGAALFFAGTFSRWRDKTIAQTITPGILFFLLSTIGFWILTHSELYSHFQVIDDFSHWGRMSKIIADSDRLIISADAISIKDYPPGMALFDYPFFQFGEFSQSRAMFSHGVFIFAAFAQLFSVIPKTLNRRSLFWVNIFFYALIYSLIYFFSSTGLHTLSVDLMVGVVFGIALFGYLANRKASRLLSILRIAPLVITLPLLKLVGILFSVVIIGVVVSDILCGSIDRREKAKLLFASLLLLTACSFSYVSWGSHIKSMGVHPTFSTKEISPSNIVKAFSPASASERQRETIEHFTNRFIPPHRTPHFWLVLYLAFFWAIWRTGKDNNPWERTVPFAVVFIGFGAYLFVLLLLYLFSFGSYEGPRLASISRYTNTYIIGMVIVSFGVALAQYFKSKRDKVTTIALILICLITMLPNSTKFLRDVSNAAQGKGGDGNVEKLVQYSNLIAKITPPKSNIYFIWQGGTNDESVIFNYGILPRTSNMNCSSVGDLYQIFDRVDVWTCQISPSEFKQKLTDFDYLFIALADEKFVHKFLRQFGFEDAQDGSLFQIIKQVGDVRLKRVPRA